MKEGLTLFFSGSKETTEVTEEAGVTVKAELLGIAIFSIASEEKCMMDDVWMCCEEVQMFM